MQYRPALVLVEWEDAQGLDTGSWAHEDDDQKYEPLIMHSVGFVLFDGDPGIILTATYSTACIAPRDQIPRGMIRKVTVLRKQQGTPPK